MLIDSTDLLSCSEYLCVWKNNNGFSSNNYSDANILKLKDSLEITQNVHIGADFKDYPSRQLCPT